MTIGVFGLGNVLRRDDGFGPCAVRYIEANYVLPRGVFVSDLGTPGLDLPSYLVGHDAVLFLDTVLDGAAAPGTIRVLDRGAMLSGVASRARLTGHEADLRTALTVTELLGRSPRAVRLVGVVPGDVSDGLGLGQAVAAALVPAVHAGLAQLAVWGVVARRAPQPPGSARPAPLEGVFHPV